VWGTTAPLMRITITPQWSLLVGGVFSFDTILLMLKIMQLLGVCGGGGVLVGGILVVTVFHKPAPAPVAVKPGSVAFSDTLNGAGSGGAQVTPGLTVTSSGDQGMVAGDSTTGGSDGSSSGSLDPGSSSAQSDGNGLPTPSQFHVYDQYKNNPTAMYIDVHPGDGKAVAQGSEVTIQYRGWLTDGKEFDETYSRGKPFAFTEGAGAVINGLAQAIFGMKQGGTRRLIIPPAVGYGSAGKDPIPADAVMIFDVELVSVN